MDKFLTVIVFVMLITIIGLQSYAQQQEKDWQELYLQSIVEVESLKAKLENAEEVINYLNSIVQGRQRDRINEAISDPQKNLTDYRNTKIPKQQDKSQ